MINKPHLNGDYLPEFEPSNATLIARIQFLYDFFEREFTDTEPHDPQAKSLAKVLSLMEDVFHDFLYTQSEE